MLERQTRQEPVAASIELEIGTSPGTVGRGGGEAVIVVTFPLCAWLGVQCTSQNLQDTCKSRIWSASSMQHSTAHNYELLRARNCTHSETPHETALLLQAIR